MGEMIAEISKHAPSGIQQSEWDSTPSNWRFRLGEFALFQVPQRSLTLNRHFTLLGETVDESQLPVERLAQGEADALRVSAAPCVDDAPRVRYSKRLICYTRLRYRRYFIELKDDFDVYVRRFSGHTRKKLRSYVNAFQRGATDAPVRVYRHASEMDEYYETIRAISERTYQEQLGKDGVPNDPSFLEMLKQRAASDGVRGYVLFDGVTPVAYAHCIAPQSAPDVIEFDLTGYRQEYAHMSPGTVVFYLMLERLFAERRFRLFDLSIGEAAYKERYATGSVLVEDLSYHLKTARNVALVALHFGLARLSRFAVKLVGEHRQALKRAIRRWSVRSYTAEAQATIATTAPQPLRVAPVQNQAVRAA